MMTTCKALWLSLVQQVNECKKAPVLKVEGFACHHTKKLGMFSV